MSDAISRGTMSDAISRGDGALSSPGAAVIDPGAKKRIMFVDDEPDCLETLKRAMRHYLGVWDVEFASGGEEALAAMADRPVDVIIADMQMPAMDGVALLAEVEDRYPMTIRMVLSGQSSAQDLTRAAAVAHRCLPKPCDRRELSSLITRSCALRELTGHAQAYRATMGSTTLPSRPGVYTELNTVLSDPRWGPVQVAEVIERDMAMTAKVLQLANSAFFGINQRVTSVKDAIVYLGVDTVRALTLTAEAFGTLAPTELKGFSFDEFQRHAMLVSRITAGILPHGRAQQEAVTAALLHDIGKLVLIADGRGRWELLSDEAWRRQVPLHVIESELEGVTHAGTGAYLLSLWGLPDCVVEAVAHHHDPGSVRGLAFDAVAAVHVADALANEVQPPADDAPPPGILDEALLDHLGLRPRLDNWRHLARQTADLAA